MQYHRTTKDIISSKNFDNVQYGKWGSGRLLVSGTPGRVEDGRGGLGHSASPRFPSPLIERSMRISRTTLSDWLHRNAHDEARDRSRLSGGHRLRIAAELLPTSPGTSGVCRLSPITMPSPSSEAHQKSGSFPPPALPGLSSTTTLSESR
jgi:hypothetical protein